jgi:hypothetical protein
MRKVRRAVAESVLLILVLSVCDTPAVAEGPLTDIVTSPGPSGAADKDALAAAVALLPEAPVLIAVIDVTQNRPPVRVYLLTLDAFTVKGNAVIYVVQQSQLLKRARAGSALYRAMLATVLWHEVAHLSGADERAARQAEEKLWMRFVRDGLADEVIGLRYLQALRRRPDDQLLAFREEGVARPTPGGCDGTHFVKFDLAPTRRTPLP